MFLMLELDMIISQRLLSEGSAALGNRSLQLLPAHPKLTGLPFLLLQLQILPDDVLVLLDFGSDVLEETLLLFSFAADDVAVLLLETAVGMGKLFVVSAESEA
jgi:hypothetical protein